MRCHLCEHEYPDYYRSRHCASGICYDCWTNEWESRLKFVAMAGGNSARRFLIWLIGADETRRILRRFRCSPRRVVRALLK